MHLEAGVTVVEPGADVLVVVHDTVVRVLPSQDKDALKQGQEGACREARRWAERAPRRSRRVPECDELLLRRRFGEIAPAGKRRPRGLGCR